MRTDATTSDTIRTSDEAGTGAEAQHGIQYQRLSVRAIEKAIREEILTNLPTRKDISAGNPINFSLDVAPVVAAEGDKLKKAIAEKDLSTLIGRYPVGETPALDQIAAKLGFTNREQYESAVRKLLMDDSQALGLVRSLFGSLASDIDSA